MNQDKVRAILEALLLAAEQPVSENHMQAAFDDVSPELIRDALSSLEIEYAGDGRGIHLVQMAGGYQFRTNPEFGDHVRAFFEAEPVRLSRAAMETLAIIAYRQPVTRAEVEDVRGVNSSGVIKTLRDYDLVDIIGQLDDIGKPYIYGTTGRFLEFFGLDGLSALPTLEESELEALVEMHENAHPEQFADDSDNDADDLKAE